MPTLGINFRQLSFLQLGIMLKSRVVSQWVVDPSGCSILCWRVQTCSSAAVRMRSFVCSRQGGVIGILGSVVRYPTTDFFSPISQCQMRCALSRVHRMGAMAVCVRMHTSPWWFKLLCVEKQQHEQTQHTICAW